MKSSIAASAAVALLSGSADAFWRMPCHSRTAFARLDPIVDPGVASSHGHVIHGGSSTLPSSFPFVSAMTCSLGHTPLPLLHMRQRQRKHAQSALPHARSVSDSNDRLLNYLSRLWRIHHLR
jgi:hypothetical protein